MRALATKLKDWWQRPKPPVAQAAPFAVDCVCGKKLTGARLASEQVVRCLSCGAERFIFPRSALPSQREETAPAAGGGAGRSRKTWLVPLAAIALTAAGLVAAYVVFVPSKNADEAASKVPLSERLEKVRKALRAGGFRRAAAEAAGVGTGELAALPAADRANAQQLLREARVFGDLLDVSLEELLDFAAAADEREWQANFAWRYAGKTVLLDVVVQQDQAGGYRVLYPLRAGVDEARIDLSGLKVLAGLDLERPRRLLFGAAVAKIKPEAPGPVWVVEFEPDSGVLLTEVDAAERCCPAWGDVETQALLERQKNWVVQIP